MQCASPKLCSSLCFFNTCFSPSRQIPPRHLCHVATSVPTTSQGPPIPCRWWLLPRPSPSPRKPQDFSDSTVLESCGAHSYTLQCPNDDENYSFTGCALSCGDPHMMSSLRTEHYGALAIVACIWMLCKRHKIHSRHFAGAVDNSAVIIQINGGLDGLQTASWYLTTDFDLWKETIELFGKIPVTANFYHFKGHQDSMYTDSFQGPFPRDALWNVKMDELVATKCLTRSTLKPDHIWVKQRKSYSTRALFVMISFWKEAF